MEKTDPHEAPGSTDDGDASGTLSHEDLLQEVEDLADVGHWRLDLEAQEVTGPDVFHEMWGFDPDREKPLNWGTVLERIHPADVGTLEQVAEEAIEGRGEVPGEVRVRRPDGSTVWIDNRVILEVEEGEEGEAVALWGISKDVTEDKETQLRLDEAQLVAQVGSWEWDIPSDALTLSDQQNDLLGIDPYSAEDLSYEDLLQAVHPDDRERVDELIQEALETGEYPTFEFRVRYDDGSVRWMENRGNVEMKDGEAVRARGTNLDITSRVLPLRRYEAIVDTTSDAIIQADEAGEVVGWNQAAEEMFGWSGEEIIGEPLTTIMPEEYRESHREGFRRFVETGEGRLMGETVELEAQRADGEVFPIELSLDTYTVGGTTRFCGIVRDVTERKEAQRALEEERRRLEEAQRVAKVGSWVWDLETGTVHWSRENYRVMGIDPDEVDELTIETVADCVHPDDRDVIEERREKAGETGEVPTVEFRVQDPDGSIRWCQGRGEVVTEDGEVVRLMGTNQDITELKRLEQALEKERDRLQEAQRVAGVGSWEWHVPTDTMNFTDQKYRLLGLDPDDPRELDLEALLQCVHPQDRDLVEENRRLAVEEGEYPTIEWRTNPDRGPVRWIREQGEVVTEDGETVLVRGTAEDVTGEKQGAEG